MFRCPRCDATFPRVLGKKHYLLVPEAEFTRLKKEVSDMQKKGESLERSLDETRKDLEQRENSLKDQVRKNVIGGLETELGQIEKHVKYLRAERDRLSKEIAKS